ncbi:tRNA lysidine(34) synthetase TilS [Actinokineospora sp. G85]|uniref:tRNA lysidine(34) synthetase TilS n=1 Tax=Actinokineospora sp. G85 TaxID=3406626 RepID=UPI003C72A6CC
MSRKPHPAVAETRVAVRRLFGDRDQDVCVAVSGGADSLALAAAARHECDRVEGLVVDHGLQAGSAEVAARAAEQLDGLGFDAVRVLTVVVDGPGGPEAAARRARHTALRSAAGDRLVLLGHTRDDQAETVLLGLGRGSGPRSIAGMRPLDPPWARPLLGVARATTRQACAALGLTPWDDPHNTDPRYTRVRLRGEVLPLLEDVLQGGVAAALARTAAQLQDDLAALDQLAEGLEPVPATLATVPAALRRRALRRWLAGCGVSGLTDAHLRSVEELVTRWRGQGGVALPGGLVARRAHGRLTCGRPET